MANAIRHGPFIKIGAPRALRTVRSNDLEEVSSLSESTQKIELNHLGLGYRNWPYKDRSCKAQLHEVLPYFCCPQKPNIVATEHLISSKEFNFLLSMCACFLHCAYIFNAKTNYKYLRPIKYNNWSSTIHECRE